MVKHTLRTEVKGDFNIHGTVPKLWNFQISHTRVHIFFHQNFSGIPKCASFSKCVSFETLSLLKLLGLGWPRVIASREANDGIVPLTCLTIVLFSRIYI